MSAVIAEKPYAMIAELPSASALYHAAEKVRDAGFTRWDVFTPFPIHGMDDAMGLKKSPIGYLVFVGGLTGATVGLLLQWYTAVYDYPLIVHGKPTNMFSVPAFFPVIFELTILFSAFTAILSLCAFNNLPRWNHPLFNWEPFAKVTDDKFFLAIEVADPKFSEKETAKFIESFGGTNIGIVKEEV